MIVLRIAEMCAVMAAAPGEKPSGVVLRIAWVKGPAVLPRIRPVVTMPQCRPVSVPLKARAVKGSGGQPAQVWWTNVVHVVGIVAIPTAAQDARVPCAKHVSVTSTHSAVRAPGMPNALRLRPAAVRGTAYNAINVGMDFAALKKARVAVLRIV